jgi:hypothetical protein
VRQLQGADDVKLDHSTRGTEEDTAGATSSSSDCGQTGGKPNYAFQASVTFGIQTSPGTVRVPRSLGGGS